MFDQLHDLPHDLVRERLLDARKERLSIEAAAAARTGGRLAALRLRIASQLGDLLISWGARLKHVNANELLGQEMTRQELVRGWAWLDRK